LILNFSFCTIRDKRKEGVVFSRYGTVGGLLKREIADLDLIYKGYGPSIKVCFKTLAPNIQEIREESGPFYWIIFEWLYHYVKAAKLPRLPQTRI
jgi:hypothetical protein